VKKQRKKRRMPQLDTGSFRGQVTWLARVFRVLYRTRAGDILPKMSQILKLRSKKRDRTRGDATQYDGERARVDAGYSGSLGKAAGTSYALLQERGEVQHGWRNQEVAKRNQAKGRNGAMKAYRGYRMKVKLAEVYVSQKLGAVAKTSKGGKAVGSKPKAPKKSK
jgi:hypothetical protein